MKRNPIPLAAKLGDAALLPLNPVELEIIQLFVQLSRVLGQPASVAEIYGLLFISPQPLPQEAFVSRLNLSKGSACQGLQYLQTLGAVRTVAMPGSRRTHYEAVAELRNLAGRFLEHQVLPYFEDSENRLDYLDDEAQKLSGTARQHAVARVKMLRSWERNGRRILPILLALLGGRKKSGR